MIQLPLKAWGKSATSTFLSSSSENCGGRLLASLCRPALILLPRHRLRKGTTSCSLMSGPSTDHAAPSPAQAIDFLSIIQSLKTNKRTGWVKRNVNNCESIADHMYRMTIMSLIGGYEDGVDKDKCVKMSAVHDIAESIVGDITPTCGVSKEEKNRRESEAIETLCNSLGNGVAAQEIRSLWKEYEQNSTLEAKLVKDFDKLEMILQAFEYEKAQKKELEEFFESTKGKFQTDLGKSWAQEIVYRRKKYFDEFNASNDGQA